MPEQKFHPGDRVRATWTIGSDVFEGATGTVVDALETLGCHVSWDKHTDLCGPDGSLLFAFDYELELLYPRDASPTVDPTQFLTLLHAP